MLARLQHRHRYLVMHRRIGDDIHRRDIGVLDHLVDIGKDQRRAAEESLDLSPAEIGVLGVQIAYRHQLNIADAALFQFFIGQYMAVAHAAAAN